MDTRETKTTITNVNGEVATQVVVEPGQESSVEITENSKGEPRVTVKIYHADPEEAMSMAVDLYHRTRYMLRQ